MRIETGTFGVARVEWRNGRVVVTCTETGRETVCDAVRLTVTEGDWVSAEAGPDYRAVEPVALLAAEEPMLIGSVGAMCTGTDACEEVRGDLSEEWVECDWEREEAWGVFGWASCDGESPASVKGAREVWVCGDECGTVHAVGLVRGEGEAVIPPSVEYAWERVQQACRTGDGPQLLTRIERWEVLSRTYGHALVSEWAKVWEADREHTVRLSGLSGMWANTEKGGAQ